MEPQSFEVIINNKMEKKMAKEKFVKTKPHVNIGSALAVRLGLSSRLQRTAAR
jgi:hypothetical protein